MERLEALGTRPARVFADLLRYFARFHRERYGWDGSPIHDAVAVGHLAHPGARPRPTPYRVDVETTSELTRGRTVVDLHGLTGKPPNVDVGVARSTASASSTCSSTRSARSGTGGRGACAPEATAGGLRYVALGDSYTIGTAVEADERLPDQLVARSGSADAGGLTLVANLGVNGYTSADLIRDELPALAGLRSRVRDVSSSASTTSSRACPLDTYEANVVDDPGRGCSASPAGRPHRRPSRSRTTRSPRPAPTTATRGSSTMGSSRNNAVMARLAAARGIAVRRHLRPVARAAATDRALVAERRPAPERGAVRALGGAHRAGGARRLLATP